MQEKAVYLIQEPGCLNPYSGAFNHISVGVRELSIDYNLKVYINDKPIKLSDYSKKIKNYSNKPFTLQKRKTKNIYYGTLKDLSILIKNLLKIPKLYSCFKNQELSFVYERMSYLDFTGLITCKILKIPHFYEVNGIFYMSRKRYYDSFFNPISKILEKLSYCLSGHVFFIGTYGEFWKLKKFRYTNIENGIEETNLIAEYDKPENQIIQLCFVGRNMDFQRVDILSNSLKKLNKYYDFKINFIGTGYSEIIDDLKYNGVNVCDHGFIGRNKIGHLLNKMDIGLISGVNEYQSCMKIFDYGASFCAVVAPINYNLKYWFENELIFFDGTSEGLFQKLSYLMDDRNKIKLFSKKLRKKIGSDFTWEKIFSRKKEIIKKIKIDEI